MPLNKIFFHDNIINILHSSLKNNTFAHAYIFSGTNGIGKKTLALEFSKAFNCLNKNDDNCGICNSCKKIDENTHPDVHLFEPADDNIRIETIREIEKEVALKPFEGRKKIYIIDDADRMLRQSANAFLKTLEEPPPDTIFILITSNLKKILATIISRCQVFRFNHINEENIQKYIKDKFGIESEKAFTLARLSEGRIGRAIDLLEDKKIEKYEESINFLEQIPQSSLLSILSKIDILDIDRNELEYILDIYLVWFRDIMIAKIGNPNNVINYSYKSVLENTAQFYSLKGLLKINSVLKKTRRYLKRNVNLRLAMEVLHMEIKENTLI